MRTVEDVLAGLGSRHTLHISEDYEGAVIEGESLGQVGNHYSLGIRGFSMDDALALLPVWELLRDHCMWVSFVTGRRSAKGHPQAILAGMDDETRDLAIACRLRVNGRDAYCAMDILYWQRFVTQLEDRGQASESRKPVLFAQ